MTSKSDSESNEGNTSCSDSEQRSADFDRRASSMTSESDSIVQIQTNHWGATFTLAAAAAATAK